MFRLATPRFATRGIALLIGSVLTFAHGGCGRGLGYRTSSSSTGIGLRQWVPGTFSSGSSFNTAPMPYAPQIGNTMVVAIWLFNSAATSIDSVGDSAGNTYLLAALANNGSTSPIAIYYATVTNTMPSFFFTAGISISLSSGVADVVAAEFSNVLSAGQLDQFVSATGGPATTANVGPTATTTQSNELVVAALTLNAGQPSITPPTGFTEIYTDIGTTYATGQLTFKVAPAVGSQSASWSYSNSASFAAAIATFRGL